MVESSGARILEAAYRVFGEHGYLGATTRRIAEAAGVNEVTVFRHYSTKETLLTAAFRAVAEHTIAALEPYALPKIPHDLRTELGAYLAVIFPPMLQTEQAHRRAIGEWGQTPELDGQLLRTTDYVYDQVQGYLERARAHGLLDASTDPAVATQMLLGALLADVLMRETMPRRFVLDPEATVAAYLDVFLHGAGRRSPTGATASRPRRKGKTT